MTVGTEEKRLVHYLIETEPHSYIATDDPAKATHVMGSQGTGRIIDIRPARAKKEAAKVNPPPGKTTYVKNFTPQKLTDKDRERVAKAGECLNIALDTAQASGEWKATWVLSDLIIIAAYPMKSEYRATAMSFVDTVEDAVSYADRFADGDIEWVSVFTAMMVSDCYKRGLAPTWMFKEDPAKEVFNEPPAKTEVTDAPVVPS